MLKDNLVSWLFQTDALRICPEGSPFWYTSGTIGPYYINTHFLYGSEQKANNLLKEIDRLKEDKLGCPDELIKLTLENYRTDNIYRQLIDELCIYIKNNLKIDEISCITGGERRDWFFSFPVAEKLKIPHVTIYKDLTSVYTFEGKTSANFDIKGGHALHIADLLNEAASYERAWIPAINSIGAEIDWSIVIVDRNQGGKQLLENSNIVSHAMVTVDKDLFIKANELGLINKAQLEMVIGYINDPKTSMREFLLSNPSFLENALKAGDKNSERARLCVEKNIYSLNI
jgi:orotate phosphoribosyltransferase